MTNPRRERFKGVMARFEPSQDPAKALKAGLYVEQPGQALASRIFATLELRPRSSHLLAGPSGAGKTTQIRLLETLLETHDELFPIFIDVTSKSDLSLSGQLGEHLRSALISRNGDSAPDRITFGKIALDILSAIAINTPSGLLEAIANSNRKPVLLLDSLDRLPFETFEKLCSADLSQLQRHMAVVVVGPPAVMYGAAREIADRFDYFVRQPTYNPAPGGIMHHFLVDVIRQRAEADLIPDESCSLLAQASGGILRDLIALTQLALEEAYVSGHTLIEPDDVGRAADIFGRKHIIGLDSSELAILRQVRKRGNFVRINDGDASLLVTRRVLEYEDEHGNPRFAIHPTLVPFLKHMGPA